MSDKQSVPKTNLGVKITLGVLERLVVQQLFPEKSNLTEMEMAGDIREKVKLIQDEQKEYGFQQSGDSLTWDNAKVKEQPFFFSQSEVRFLKDQVERVNKSSQITADMVSLCRKIRDTHDKGDTELV